MIIHQTHVTQKVKEYGEQGRPIWRSRSYRPIESKRCYECGKLGHLSYDCPKLQVQGKLTNVAKSSQMFYNKSKDASSGECDSESFSEGEYEKGEYEVQAFAVSTEAGRILSLQEEVPIRLSTMKKVTYQEQDQCCVKTFLHYMP